MIFSPMAPSNIANAAKAGEREVERVKPLAQFPTELLSEQHLDIRLVIDNQHPYGHGTGPLTIWRHVWAFGFVAMFPPGWSEP